MREGATVVARMWLFALSAGLAWALAVAPAAGLTLAAPADVHGSAAVRVTLAAVDVSGTVLLVRDGVVVAERPTAGARAVDFPPLSLQPGMHHWRAILRATDGFASTRAFAHTYSWGTPTAPRWVAPAGGLTGSPVEVRVYAGSSTASMTLSVNGVALRSVACVPGRLTSFGQVRVGPGVSTYTITERSRFGETAVFSTTARRLEYPFANCIIVDKSDFRLYWVRGGQLVKAYPIAHGRGNCTPIAVWKILAKYRTDPRGVYGPRKMRLFRRSGIPGRYRYTFTAYGIHGTNQEWVIGTMASHGCIRMYNRDVLELWPQVPLGTMVITRP